MSEEHRIGERAAKATTTSPRRWSRAWLSPWIAILLLTGGFQVYRGAPVDGGVFFFVAVALLLDALRQTGRPAAIARLRLPRLNAPFRAVVVAAACIAAILIVSAVRSVFDAIVLCIAGIITFVAVLPSPAERDGRTADAALRRAAIIWALIAVAVCVWELSAFFLGPVNTPAAYNHPTISSLVEPAVQSATGRIVFVALWVTAGAAFVVHGRKNP